MTSTNSSTWDKSVVGGSNNTFIMGVNAFFWWEDVFWKTKERNPEGGNGADQRIDRKRVPPPPPPPSPNLHPDQDSFYGPKNTGSPSNSIQTKTVLMVTET